MVHCRFVCHFDNLILPLTGCQLGISHDRERDIVKDLADILGGAGGYP